MAASSLLNTVLYLINTSSWVSDSDWTCISAITNAYFKADTRFLILDEYFPQYNADAFRDAPIYIYTFSESKLLFSSEVIIITNDLDMKLFGFRGTSNHALVITPWDQKKVVEGLRDIYFVLNTVAMFVSELKTELFSWFYYGGFNCTMKGQADLVYQDSCINGALIRGTDLYPPKVPDQVNGCPLYITSMPSFASESKSLLSYYNFRGPMYKLTNVLTHKLNGTLIAEVKDYNSYDVSYDDFKFKPRRLSLENYDLYALSPPIYQGEYILAVPAPNPNLFSSLYAGFSALSWSLSLAALLAMIIFVTVANHLSETCQTYSISDVLRTALGNSVVGRPKHFLAFQTIVIIFELYSLHLIWFYQTNSLKNLFVGSFEKPIKTWEDAAERQLFMYHTDEWYHSNSYGGKKKPYAWIDVLDVERTTIAWPMKIVKSFMEVTENKTAMFADLKQDIFFRFRSIYPLHALDSKIRLLQPPLGVDHYSLGMDKTHPLQARVFRYILHIIEAGLIAEWVKVASEVELSGNEQMQRPISMLHMQPVFFVVCVLLGLANLLFLFEVSAYKIIKYLLMFWKKVKNDGTRF